MVAAALTISGWFVSSVFSKLLDRALSYYKGQKSWQSGMKADLERLVRFQPQIETLIYMAERAHLPRDPNLPLYKWLAQLQDAVEEADNVLDELEYRQLKGENMVVKFALRAIKQDDLLKRLREVVKTFNDLVTGLDTFAQDSKVRVVSLPYIWFSTIPFVGKIGSMPPQSYKIREMPPQTLLFEKCHPESIILR
ncbi:hypothetical protein LUZ61_008694 [Rhynchospora tenuis]|uniref:Disease resistance N-terminal domain-containing protein n=1 Tax=Rhynchospora tenuis TaxID=198213 RepID=A0AAD5ZVU5_9POAL|nr:hypothetical protein LUZ61_008694 [Rhynchospora tenuis]